MGDSPQPGRDAGAALVSGAESGYVAYHDNMPPVPWKYLSRETRAKWERASLAVIQANRKSVESVRKAAAQIKNGD